MQKINSKTKRKIRNRKKLKDINTNKLRITVFKSSKNINLSKDLGKEVGKILKEQSKGSYKK